MAMMRPDSERKKLKQSACESARQMLKIIGYVVAGCTVLVGMGWLILSGIALVDSLCKSYPTEMQEGVCALAWLSILMGNFVWLTCNRFKKIQGREPSGKYGYLMLSIMGITFMAELLLTGTIAWMIFNTASIGRTDAFIMSLTTLALMISVGIKMPDSGRG